MEDVVIAVKQPNKPVEFMKVHGGYRSDIVKRYIDDYAQFVSLDGEDGLLSMAVDDCGLMKELDTNFYLSTNVYPAERIVGTAVFTRHKYVNVYREEVYDYTVESLSVADIEAIKRLLDEDLQNKLKLVYDTNPKPSIRFEVF